MWWEEVSKAIDEWEDKNPTMNINTIPGTKVMYCYPDNGSDLDVKWTKQILTLFEIYTVESIEVGQSMSVVRFNEFPELEFNTVHFANIEEDVINDK